MFPWQQWDGKWCINKPGNLLLQPLPAPPQWSGQISLCPHHSEFAGQIATSLGQIPSNGIFNERVMHVNLDSLCQTVLLKKTSFYASFIHVNLKSHDFKNQESLPKFQLFKGNHKISKPAGGMNHTLLFGSRSQNRGRRQDSFSQERYR